MRKNIYCSITNHRCHRYEYAILLIHTVQWRWRDSNPRPETPTTQLSTGLVYLLSFINHLPVNKRMVDYPSRILLVAEGGTTSISQSLVKLQATTWEIVAGSRCIID